jgi:hypothetical protein
MFITLTILIPILTNIAFDILYISCLLSIILYFIYHKIYLPLYNKLEKVTQKYNYIMEEHYGFKNRIVIMEQQLTNQLEHTESYENTFSSSNNIVNNSKLFPLQNHISFPTNVIINNDLFKLMKKKPCSSLAHPKLLSDNLCKFLKLPIGTCLKNAEIIALMNQYFYDNQLFSTSNPTLIEMNSKLYKLFGTTEHEDYELTINNLEEYLLPHLKTI